MPDTTVFFSIIIPTYNRGQFILNTIGSALNQEFTAYEVIVVDDGSTDDTEELVASVRDARLSYYKIKNSERGAARNFGAAKAKGEYLTFLDSDDVLYPVYLSNAYDSIQKDKCPPFFHLAYEVKNEKGEILTKINFIKPDTYKFLVYGNPLSCLGVFIERQTFEKFRFNEDRDLSGSEDWELWLRLVANCGIKTDSRISAAIISHTQRSVLNSNETKLLLRKKLSLDYAFRDAKVREKFLKHFPKIESHFDTYNALHLAMSGSKNPALACLKNAVLTNPGIIFSKRFLAAVKLLVFKKATLN